MLSTDIKINNYATYKRYLENLIGEEIISEIVNKLGGEEKLINASFGMTPDSGCAYGGSLLQVCIDIAQKACEINKLLPENMQVSPKSIYKVVLLQHIGKVVMYKENDNDWEVRNRGILYKFNNDQDTVMKCGERSLFICQQCGVTFDEYEYEAMRVIDRMKEDDAVNTLWNTSILTMIVRQANEVVNMIYRTK